MENTSLVGLSRQVALRRELDVIANNIANINTTGFKADALVFQEFLSPGAREDTFQRGQDRRVSFVWDRASTINLQQGALDSTGNPLDVALGGRGFLVVQTPEGERYTRNGSLEINTQGQLVTKQGLPVLGENGPITFEPTDTAITIARDGAIGVRGGTRGRLRVVEATSPNVLEKAGDNLFRTRQGATIANAERPDVRQGFVERSNVSPVRELSRMIEVNRAYSSLAQSIERHDQIRRDAIRSLGEVQR